MPSAQATTLDNSSDDPDDVHSVGKYEHGYGGRRDDAGRIIIPPVTIPGIQWDREKFKEQGFRDGLFPHRTIIIKDPKIYKGTTPCCFSVLDNNCTTYARDAWYFYSGEWAPLPGPDLPSTLRAWVIPMNQPVKKVVPKVRGKKPPTDGYDPIPWGFGPKY